MDTESELIYLLSGFSLLFGFKISRRASNANAGLENRDRKNTVRRASLRSFLGRREIRRIGSRLLSAFADGSNSIATNVEPLKFGISLRHTSMSSSRRRVMSAS